MNIVLKPLSKPNLPLLLKWLQAPHVKAWWDSDIDWNLALIWEKYGTYLEGYKYVNQQKKPLKAYIIKADNQPVGYLQFYNVRDFNDDIYLNRLPPKLAAIDMYIGEPSQLNQGIGSKALQILIKQFIALEFDNVLVTPDLNNYQAIACYRKAGFKPIYRHLKNHELWLLRNCI
ncbi:GNAT family N-acetyltransferase [Legionella sp. D16C41]|uniref:GNAT family N-acetyltransferase n=1 Tax=Legionella sp. D16C41 TaxID=3402688 RepID=UPI003AF95E9E